MAASRGFLCQLTWATGPTRNTQESDAGEGDDHEDGEGPVKVAGALQNKSGECRSDNTGEISDEVLEAGPASGGLGSRKCLCNRPDIGRKHAEKNHAQNERGNAIVQAR